MTVRALLGMALFNAMIISSIFYHVGGERFVIDPMDPFNKDNAAKNRQI